MSFRRVMVVSFSAALLAPSISHLSAQTGGAPGASTAPGEAPRPDREGLKEGERRAVIPEGQEDLLSEMLGRGATIAGCTLASGSVSGTTVRGTYTCPAGEVVLQLVHPSKAPAGATKTERFAITAERGTPPPNLIGELAQRVRSHEARFEWRWLDGPTPVPRTETSTQPLSFPLPFVAAGAGALVVVLALWALLRRRSQ